MRLTRHRFALRLDPGRGTPTQTVTVTVRGLADATPVLAVQVAPGLHPTVAGPTSLVLTIGDPAPPPLRLWSRGGDPLQVTRVEATVPGVSATPAQPAAGRICEIAVRLPADATPTAGGVRVWVAGLPADPYRVRLIVR